MKKHWLRGVWLGVSLALLLAGGVALAAGLYATRDKGCVECYPVEIGPPEALPITPPDKYVVNLTYGGWIHDSLLPLCWRFVPPNMPPPPWQCPPQPAQDPHTMPPWFVPCGGFFPIELPLLPEGVDPSNGVESLYGRWTFEVEQRDQQQNPIDSARVSWLFQGCCEEFVPEPGTIVLLGSGLAGLAGYATLRWRTRE